MFPEQPSSHKSRWRAGLSGLTLAGADRHASAPTPLILPRTDGRRASTLCLLRENGLGRHLCPSRRLCRLHRTSECSLWPGDAGVTASSGHQQRVPAGDEEQHDTSAAPRQRASSGERCGGGTEQLFDGIPRQSESAGTAEPTAGGADPPLPGPQGLKRRSLGTPQEGVGGGLQTGEGGGSKHLAPSVLHPISMLLSEVKGQLRPLLS